MSVDTLLDKLATEGGCIVSTGDCTEIEITNAGARGDMWVDNEGLGYIRRLPEWLQLHDPYCRNSQRPKEARG